MRPIQPDLDQAVINYYANLPEAVQLHGGRVSTLLQSPLTSMRVANIGGPGDVPWEAPVGFSLECWGGDQGQANRLARVAWSAAFDIRDVVIEGGRMTNGRATSLPFWAPDENGRPRYITQIAVTSYPEGST